MSISFFAECTVLITGASAGIGREFARQLAPAVNTMILVARRNDRLEALELELKIVNPGLEVFCRQLDLRDQADSKDFATGSMKAGCPWICWSITPGSAIAERSSTANGNALHAMLQVNIETLTYLTYRILPSMRKSGCGAILNVSSVASLVPVPNLAVYAATKAYVTSFSEALRAELRNSNISVTALCPGPVPTEFADVASRGPQEYLPLQRRNCSRVPVQEVVRRALHAVSRDKARVIPGTLVNLGDDDRGLPSDVSQTADP